jgi:peptide/nickel transport system substrate-binding protein
MFSGKTQKSRTLSWSGVVGLVVGLSVLLATAGATGATSGGSAVTAKGPFIVNYAVPTTTLDPAVVCNLPDDGFLSNFYVTLTQFASIRERGQPGITRMDVSKAKPYLAKSWKISPDGKTYTFNLRSDAKFPSGKPVDSEAVKFSFDRAIKIGGCGNYFMNAGQTDKIIQSISAPNPTTVVMKLRRPEALVLRALAAPNNSIVDPAVVNAHGGVTAGKPNKWMASHTAGSGPYLLQSYDPGRQAVFVANPTFFGPKPREPKVIVNFITSDTTLLLQARSGRAHVTMGLTKASAHSLLGNPCCRVVPVHAPLWQYVTLPNTYPPFDNAIFRRALTHALPYKEILKQVAFGFGELYYGPFAPAMSAFNTKLSKPRKYDLELARALINQSGVKTPVNLQMYIREGQNDQAEIATIVQASWRSLGVNVTITKQSAAAYTTALSKPKKRYSLVRFDGPGVPDPEWLLSYDMACGSAYNADDYCNRKADALLATTHKILNPAARQAVWDKITRIWLQDSPRIVVYEDDYVVVLKKGVRYWHYHQSNFAASKWGQ